MAVSSATEYDVVIRGGTIYDGSGSMPFIGDIAVDGDSIAVVGSLAKARSRLSIETAGLAIAPRFMNLLI